MIKVYHNPRCRKSREGLEIVKSSGQDFEIIEYLKTPLTKEELINILKLLEKSPMQLVRTNETIWKDQYKGKELSDEAIIEAMISHPKLIERPIVVKNHSAIVGRPPELIQSIL